MKNLLNNWKRDWNDMSEREKDSVIGFSLTMAGFLTAVIILGVAAVKGAWF